MTTVRQRGVIVGMGFGVAWALGLLVVGAYLVPAPSGAPMEIAARWLLAPALCLIATVGAVANRRFFDPAIIDGDAPAAGSPADIDRRVLINTAEQALLAALVWPALAFALPPARLGVIPALSIGFVAARAAFWIGYRLPGGAPSRSFGFAATFYPAVFAAALALVLWLSG